MTVTYYITGLIDELKTWHQWRPVIGGLCVARFMPGRPIHTGDKVEFNTKSTVSLWPRTHWQHSRTYRPRQQSRPRQAVKCTLLPFCCQNGQQSWTYTATVDFVADLLPVTATVDFQQSRPYWIQLGRQCVIIWSTSKCMNGEKLQLY